MQHSVIDERSLALDKVVVRHLREEPSLVTVAKATLKRWLSHCSDNVRPDLQKWQVWLDGDFESLLEFLESDSPDARRLRQSSPFAGPTFVSREERNQIFKRFRDDDTRADDTQS